MVWEYAYLLTSAEMVQSGKDRPSYFIMLKNNPIPASNYKYLPYGILLVVMNLVDAVSTVLHIDSNAMYEYSPITAPLLSISTAAFIIVKHLLVTFMVLLVLRSRPKLIKVAFGITLPVYATLTVWHIVLFTYYGV